MLSLIVSAILKLHKWVFTLHSVRLHQLSAAVTIIVKLVCQPQKLQSNMAHMEVVRWCIRAKILLPRLFYGYYAQPHKMHIQATCSLKHLCINYNYVRSNLVSADVVTIAIMDNQK